MLLLLLLKLLLACSAAIIITASSDNDDDEQQCERLKASVTYTQEEAPRDLSGVLPVVIERVNQALSGVVNVEVEWTGADLQAYVGEHIIRCEVTRRIENENTNVGVGVGDSDTRGGRLVTQCFHVPFTITDTDECMLPMGHAMKHQCQYPSFCVNTIGSYECVCPRTGQQISQQQSSSSRSSSSVITVGSNDDIFWDSLASEKRNPWEVALNASTLSSSCPSLPSTRGCCPGQANSKDGVICRSLFRCPIDPCISKTTNDCVSTSTCIRTSTPIQHPNYICQCATGLMGNGHICQQSDPKPNPKVIYDGKTPTQETIKNNYYCGCTQPVVDACSGFPPCKGKHEICTIIRGNSSPICACKPGYVKHDKYGCVDESPPVLRLNHDIRGDHILRLKQGDIYKEYAVDIEDENAEEYLRSLKITYSIPLPRNCFTKIGEFHVNYTIATPWTSPPFVRITRRVIVDDIDECNPTLSSRFKTSCPPLVPHCDIDAGAKCINTIGSYTCQCPKYTTGDGFLADITSYKQNPDSAPEGYAGGTGCYDTNKPVISLAGPNPKIFRVCACSGISGIIGSSSSKKKKSVVGGGRNEKSIALKTAQQTHYDTDVRDLIVSTSGAELCASHSQLSPKPVDCVVAYDQTYTGRTDLSSSVKVGEPVQKSALQWSVPYDVKDAAGNAAATVWRTVRIEEVDISDVEQRIRTDIMREKDAEIQRAVANALEQERSRRGSGGGGGFDSVRSRRTTTTSTQACPKCPECICPSTRSSSSSVGFDPSYCDAICEERTQRSCSAVYQQQHDSWLIRLIRWFERLFPTLAVFVIMSCIGLAGMFFILRLIFTLVFNPYAYQEGGYYYYNGTNSQQQTMHNNTVQYYPPENNNTYDQTQQSSSSIGHPSNSNDSSSLFSPGLGGGGISSNAGQQQHYTSPRNIMGPYRDGSISSSGGSRFGDVGVGQQAMQADYDDHGIDDDDNDIYEVQSPSLITPSRRVSGVRRRSPYTSYTN